MYRWPDTTRNTAIVLTSLGDALRFGHVVRLAGGNVPEILNATIRPGHDDALDHVTRADSEGHRQFRLRQVARPAAHHARLRDAAVHHAHRRADRIAVGRRPDQAQAKAPVRRLPIIPE